MDANTTLAAIIINIGHLPEKHRQVLIKTIVEDYEKDVQEACSHFQKCDACDTMVSSVTAECDGADDSLESVCDDCVTHCVCGEDVAPSGAYRHEDCGSHFARCYCGETIDLEDPKLHGDKCYRLASLVFTVEGDGTEQQRLQVAKVMSDHQMSGFGPWTSIDSFKVTALHTFEKLIEEHQKSCFGRSCGQALGELSLEFVSFKIDFVSSDGTTETTDLSDELEDMFRAPDADSDENFDSIVLRMTMKFPDKNVKKRKR